MYNSLPCTPIYYSSREGWIVIKLKTFSPVLLQVMPVSSHKYVKGLRRNSTLPTSQPRLQMNHHRQKPNLQKPMNNEDGACPVPTLVNIVTSVNPNPKTAPKYSESTGNLINKLRETINVYNKEKCSLSTKHRIMLIGDSNIKGYVCNLKLLLSSNYELYSVKRLL